MDSRLVAIPEAPGKVPWLGHAIPLGRNTCRFLVEHYQKLGPVYHFSIPGRNYISLAGIEANRFLMKYEDEYFSSKKTYPLITKELETENYLNAMDGKGHMAHRKVVKPFVSKDILTESSVEKIKEVVKETTARWCQEGTISVLPEMQSLFLNAFSIMTGSMLSKDLERSFVTFTNTFITAGAAIKPKWFLKLPAYLRAKKKVWSFLENGLYEAYVTGESDTIFSRISQQTTLNEHDKRAIALLPFLNSSLYVGRTATVMLHYWMERPEIMEEVRKESETLYLLGSLYESLRLVPMAVAHPRVVKKPFEFGGFQINQNSNVMFAVSVTHFLEEYFPEPMKFRPERYVESKRTPYHPPVFSSFGLGPHSCLGSRLVEALMQVMMPMIIAEVDFSKTQPYPEMRWTADPVPGPSNKWTVKVTCRCKNV